MIYRDYSRKEGEWIPNRYGGRENIEAIEFLRRLNAVVRERWPRRDYGCGRIDSLAGVTTPVEMAALASFTSGTWDGCTNVVLRLTRPRASAMASSRYDVRLLYAFSERFVLPLSHDEVVHGKGSLYGRSRERARQGRDAARFFRLHVDAPGQELLFMGVRSASRPNGSRR